MTRSIPMTTVDTDALAERFRTVRRFTEELAEPLSAEDCAVQSMPDVSPTRWHLAHTTWFFDTFFLSQKSGYRAFDTIYAYLFNSYYNVVGNQFPRSQRGLITRPGLADVMEYRRHVDAQMMNLLTSEDGQNERLAEVTEIGIQHEQQHQELILTDIKHVLSRSPLRPTYRQGTFAGGADKVLSNGIRMTREFTGLATKETTSVSITSSLGIARSWSVFSLRVSSSHVATICDSLRMVDTTVPNFGCHWDGTLPANMNGSHLSIGTGTMDNGSSSHWLDRFRLIQTGRCATSATLRRMHSLAGPTRVYLRNRSGK